MQDASRSIPATPITTIPSSKFPQRSIDHRSAGVQVYAGWVSARHLCCFTLVVQSSRECDRQGSGYPRGNSRLSRDASTDPNSIRLSGRRRNTRGFPEGVSHRDARIGGRRARRSEGPFALPFLDARSDRRMYRRAIPKLFAWPRLPNSALRRVGGTEERRASYGCGNRPI